MSFFPDKLAGYVAVKLNIVSVYYNVSTCIDIFCAICKIVEYTLIVMCQS